MTRRYEREIAELLDRDEREHRGRERIERVRRNVHQARHRVSPNPLLEKLGPLGWMVGSLTLAIVAFVLHTSLPTVAGILVLVAVGLFFVPVVWRSGASEEQKTWRGQVIDLPPRTGPFQKLRRYLWQARRDRRRQQRDRFNR